MSQFFGVDAGVFQHADGNALTEAQQSEQDMLSADVVVVKAVRLSAGEVENLLGSGSEVIHIRNSRKCVNVLRCVRAAWCDSGNGEWLWLAPARLLWRHGGVPARIVPAHRRTRRR